MMATICAFATAHTCHCSPWNCWQVLRITMASSHFPQNSHFNKNTPDVTFLKVWYPYFTNETEQTIAPVFSLVLMACNTSDPVSQESEQWQIITRCVGHHVFPWPRPFRSHCSVIVQFPWFSPDFQLCKAVISKFDKRLMGWRPSALLHVTGLKHHHIGIGDEITVN